MLLTLTPAVRAIYRSWAFCVAAELALSGVERAVACDLPPRRVIRLSAVALCVGGSLACQAVASAKAGDFLCASKHALRRDPHSTSRYELARLTSGALLQWGET